MEKKVKLYAPSYYPSFRCIADACRHSCCIGWEIDIDEETLSLYRSQKGAFGKRLRDNIEENDECACFRLVGEEERCPFLNEKGLCDIILQMGEESLSQICTDHPRFRNFFSDRTEIGLGICCEEACRLLLEQKEKIFLIPIGEEAEEAEDSTEWESELRTRRETMLTIAQDVSLPISSRIRAIYEKAEVEEPRKTSEEIVAFFLSLERLDKAWDNCLARRRAWTEAIDVQEEQSARRLGNLLWYFLYRHTANAEDLVDFRLRAAFAAFSVTEIYAAALALGEGKTPDEKVLAEIARLYSSEIEYSEENTKAVLAFLSDGIE